MKEVEKALGIIRPIFRACNRGWVKVIERVLGSIDRKIM